MKRLRIFKEHIIISFKKLFTFRVHIFGELFGQLVVPMILAMFFWTAVIKDNDIGYTVRGMITYIFISNIILLFTEVHIEHDVEGDIKTQKFGQKMMLPVRYFSNEACRIVTKSISRFLLIYLPMLLVAVIFSGESIQWINLGIFVLFIVLGFCMNLLMSFIIGGLAFWLTEVWGISAMRNLITGILAGAYFPLDIMPEGAADILMKTPFPYMTYVPSKILIDREFPMSMVGEGILISILWILILSLVAACIMRFGNRKYTSNGA